MWKFLAFLGSIFVGMFYIFFEKCYFEEHEKCPQNWFNVNANNETTKPRGPDVKIVFDKPIISYIYRADGIEAPKAFGEGSILHSGDHYKILFEPAKDGYIYIFQIDSAHKIFQLFPTINFKNADPNNINPIKKTLQYFVPAEDWSFKLDATIGKETIYFVFSSQRDEMQSIIYSLFSQFLQQSLYKLATF